MMDLALFKNGTFTGANVAMLLVALAMFGVFYFLSLYMQNILGFTATETGAAFLPMTLLIMLIAPAAGSSPTASVAVVDRDRADAAVRPALLLLDARHERALLGPAAGLAHRRASGWRWR